MVSGTTICDHAPFGTDGQLDGLRQRQRWPRLAVNDVLFLLNAHIGIRRLQLLVLRHTSCTDRLFLIIACTQP